jgi:hypothetical protein
MLATLTLAAVLAVPSPVSPETRYDARIPTLKQRRRTGRASSSTRGARRAAPSTSSCSAAPGGWPASRK